MTRDRPESLAHAAAAFLVTVLGIVAVIALAWLYSR